MTPRAHRTFLAGFFLLFSASLLAQQPVTDCSGTLAAWAVDVSMRDYMATHSCSCRCNTCEPDCVARGGAHAAPWSGGHYSKATTQQMFAQQMTGMILEQLIQYAFADPKVDEAALAAQRQKEEEQRKKQEEERQQLLAAWHARQLQAARDQNHAQAQDQQAANDLLGQMQSFDGTGPSSNPLAVEPVAGAFGTMQLKPVDGTGGGVEYKPMSGATYDTSGLNSWQRALCAAYLSQSALSVANRDPEQARYFNDQAALAMSGQPIAEKCTFPTLPDAPQPAGGPSMEQTVRTMELVQTRAKDLQEIDTHLQKVRSEKHDAETKEKQAADALAQAQAQRDQAKPGDPALLAEIQQKINEAQCQLNDATRQLDALSHETDTLLQRKDAIRQELEKVQLQIQGGG